MLKGHLRDMDNISKAYTKSSKTIKSKLNAKPEVEVKQKDPPYFKNDHIRQEIEERAKKKEKSTSIMADKKMRLHKAGKIVESLLKRQQEAEERLKRLKEEAGEKNREVYTF